MDKRIKQAMDAALIRQDMTDERQPTTDEAMGIAWWNGLTERERASWMRVTGNTGKVADAWDAFKRIKQAMDAALKYRRDEQQQAGVVLVWAGEAYGWKNELRDPQHERPGVLAVDANGAAWLAVGGNDQDGARSWEAIKNP